MAHFEIVSHNKRWQYERVIAFDGDSSGKHDHLFFYSARNGAVCVAKAENKKLKQLYKVSKGGIAGWSFGFFKDKAVAFDYESSGKLDHIIIFRPGAGACFILKSLGGGRFNRVYTMPAADQPSETAGNGLGVWQLRQVWEKMFAFDYDHSGKLDHLCIYRRKQKVFAILSHEGNTWKLLYNQHGGIGGYPMGSEEDYAQAIDWDHKGCRDHILFCRFGDWVPDYMQALAAVVAHQGDRFVTVWKTGRIAGLNTFAHTLRAFVYDFTGTGYVDHIGLYTVTGKGLFWVVQGGDHLRIKYKTGSTAVGRKADITNGDGIGGFPFVGKGLRCIAFDFGSTGRDDNILIWGSTGYYVIGRHTAAIARAEAASTRHLAAAKRQAPAAQHAAHPEVNEIPDSTPEPSAVGGWVPNMEAFPKNSEGEPMDFPDPQGQETAVDPPDTDIPVIDESAAGII